MAKLLLAVTGTHSRNESTIQATQDWERGRIDYGKLKEIFREDCNDFVQLQRHLGFDFVSDGQFTLAWQDFLRPFTNGVDGITKGPLVRWFNTNTFYYTPVIKSDISTDGKVLWRRIERRFLGNGVAYKVVLPEPLTFADLADDRFYRNKEKLMFAFADQVLKPELRTLARAGVKYVQFSSPSLVARFRGRPLSSDQLKQLGEAVKAALRGVNVRSGFHTQFGDASPYFPEIFDAISTDDLGFDFTQTDPRSLPRTKKGIIAGVADARSSYLEAGDEMGAKVTLIADRTGSRSITVSPSSDLRYLPRVVADKKLEALAHARRSLGAA